jgi:hypothetical protein
MKSYFLTAIISAGLLSISTTAMSANGQNGSDILKDKAISYAIQYQKDTHFDLKAASRDLSQNAIDLGKIYGSGYQLKLTDITSTQCVEEVANLGIDSETFVKKALAGQYKTIVNVNGNIVMLVAGGAGELTYTVIDRGGYCMVDKSVHDAYWAATVIRMSIDVINVTFS